MLLSQVFCDYLGAKAASTFFRVQIEVLPDRPFVGEALARYR